jgi:ABC-type dipeptide/oligopeptide/nickel transport system permease subunit
MTVLPQTTMPDRRPVHLWRDAAIRLLRNPAGAIGLAIVLLLLAAAIFGPLVLPYDFLDQDLTARNALPSAAHWLGTDDLGRDILSRVIYGARTAFLIAVGVTALSLVIGLILGLVAGYAGGLVDRLVMWLCDVTMSVPALLLVIVINTSLRPLFGRWMDQLFELTRNPFFRDTSLIDLVLVFGSIALLKWPQYARLVRSQVLVIRNSNYVRAAVALGLPPATVLRTAILPNVLSPLIVAASFGLGTAMVLESAFSFLGVGIEPPIPSWGRMISDGMRVWATYPHLLIAPAIVLGMATIGFAFLGDGLNDALNPKRHG